MKYYFRTTVCFCLEDNTICIAYPQSPLKTQLNNRWQWHFYFILFCLIRFLLKCKHTISWNTVTDAMNIHRKALYFSILYEFLNTCQRTWKRSKNMIFIMLIFPFFCRRIFVSEKEICFPIFFYEIIWNVKFELICRI